MNTQMDRLPVRRREGRREPAAGSDERKLRAELRRLEAELERERRSARLLREALEAAASYFAPFGEDPAGEAAWRQIVHAIRSGAGRS